MESENYAFLERFQTEQICNSFSFLFYLISNMFVRWHFNATLLTKCLVFIYSTEKKILPIVSGSDGLLGVTGLGVDWTVTGGTLAGTTFAAFLGSGLAGRVTETMLPVLGGLWGSPPPDLSPLLPIVIFMFGDFKPFSCKTWSNGVYFPALRLIDKSWVT